MEHPAGFTMLLAREVPPSGGDTSFLNMYRAYEELPDDLRRRVEGVGQAPGEPRLDRPAPAGLSGP